MKSEYHLTYVTCHVCGRENHPQQPQCWVCGAPFTTVPTELKHQESDGAHVARKVGGGIGAFLGTMLITMGGVLAGVLVGLFLAIALVVALFAACIEICTGGSAILF